MFFVRLHEDLDCLCVLEQKYKELFKKIVKNEIFFNYPRHFLILFSIKSIVFENRVCTTKTLIDSGKQNFLAFNPKKPKKIERYLFRTTNNNFLRKNCKGGE